MILVYNRKRVLGMISAAWNIMSATWLQDFSVSAQDNTPLSLVFKPDGTKFYILGFANKTVYEYDLGTAWDVSTVSYSTKSFSVNTQDVLPAGLFFKPDGTKMYMVGTSSDRVHEYNLGTAWDVSTASFLQNFSVSGQDGIPIEVSFKEDGTKMYVLGFANKTVYEYDLGTAWDVSTASFLQSISISAQTTLVSGLFFKPDGTKMYVGEYNPSVSSKIFEYNLGTAWDVSTTSFNQSINVLAKESALRDLAFKTDGTKMYILGDGSDKVNEYNL